MTPSLTRQIEQYHTRKRAAEYCKSAALRTIICDAGDHVIGLCVKGAPQQEIEQALDTLSALTGIPRKDTTQ